MRSPKPPKAPDPLVTAQAQAGMNRDTAQASQLTNMINQYTPEGNLTYTPTGTNYTYTDSQGNVVNIPQYSATQTYSPQEQELYDLSSQTEKKIGQIGLDQAGRIGSLLGKPVDLSNQATEARLFELGSRRLDPRFERQEDSLRTALANKGITEGSAAWNAEMQNFGQDRNDAYNQLLLTGRGQATQEALAERNQPINEISALLSQSQVSQPNFMGTPQTQVGGVDYAGMVRDKYNADYNAYAAQVSNQNAMMGGLFGLAAAPFGMFRFSDPRVKTNIRRVGTLDNGLAVYAYSYITGGPTEIGIMADEVLDVHPDAVAQVGDVLVVNYDRAVMPVEPEAN